MYISFFLRSILKSLLMKMGVKILLVKLMNILFHSYFIWFIHYITFERTKIQSLRESTDKSMLAYTLYTQVCSTLQKYPQFNKYLQNFYFIQSFFLT